MATQEERIAILEKTTREYRPVLQNFAYEMTMVKGLIIEQTGITQELRRDMDEVKSQLDTNNKHLDTIDTRLERVEILLNQIIQRLPRNPQ